MVGEVAVTIRRALELDPSQAIVYYWYGEYLMSRGQPEEAISVTQQAHQMDPLSPVIASSLGMILYLARRYDQALRVLQRTMEISPEHFLPHLRMGLVSVQIRKYDQAIFHLKKAVKLARQSTETQTALASACAAAGRRQGAAEILTHLEVPRGQRYVLPYNLAKTSAAGRHSEKVFEWLEIAYQGATQI